MKCINKIFMGLAAVACCITFSGCSMNVTVNNPYDVYETTSEYGMLSASAGQSSSLMAEDLCVGGAENTDSDAVDTATCESAAVFTLKDNDITYSKNIYEKIYPASTTKILTCLLVLKYGNLDDIVTVSADAVNTLPSGSSVCGLKEGDQIRLGDLLYGLMLCSGNDAANAIAEHMSGSNEAFAVLMNEEAMKIGATHSHFTNPHGLPDDDHYTTLYDMYLIFHSALQNDSFLQYISAKSFDVSYTDSSGNEVSQTWTNTNGYMKGLYEAPDNITVIGGKTGTTDSAGYCLILYSKDDDGDPIISMIFKSDSKDHLYGVMSDLLTNFSN